MEEKNEEEKNIQVRIQWGKKWWKKEKMRLSEDKFIFVAVKQVYICMVVRKWFLEKFNIVLMQK
jgi:hypothetical protein